MSQVETGVERSRNSHSPGIFFLGNHLISHRSISFFGDIPPLSEIQVVGADRDTIVDYARLSMQQALEHYPGTQPTVALLLSCTGRIHVIGTRTYQEYQVLQAEMPAGVTCAGFYTYGEIAPLQPNGEAQFHNETFVTLLLGVE